MQNISSPCNKNCDYNSKYEFCTSCYRSSLEISNWLYLSDETRLKIMRSLNKRKKTMKTNEEK